MVAEVLRALDVRPAGRYLDATFGGGGHASSLLAALSDQGQLIGMDRDPTAVADARGTSSADARLRLVCDRFSNMSQYAEEGSLDGVLMDLGLSSMQLDDDSRGFSFHSTGPLDMRMDSSGGLTAADWLETAPLEQMEQVFREYGGERHARAVAEEIDRARQLSSAPATADDLAALICRIKPARDGRRHPATRVFQALRILVNRELEELTEGLRAAVRLLKAGGRLVIISFHSLEAALVARTVRECASLDFLGRALRPQPTEVRANPRSRSALLHRMEKAARPGGKP